MIKNEYQRIQNLTTESSYSDLIHEIQYKYPNLGFQSGGGLGFGQKGTLPLSSNGSSDSDVEQYNHIHDKFNNLLKAVEEHNYWSITNPGCQKYHLKNLGFGNYTHFQDFFPGIISTKEKVEPFPKAISIMMQENLMNLVSVSIVNDVVIKRLDGEILEAQAMETLSNDLGHSFSLRKGDGQIGVITTTKSQSEVGIGVFEASFLGNYDQRGAEASLSPFIKPENSAACVSIMHQYFHRFRENNRESWLGKQNHATLEHSFGDLPPRPNPGHREEIKGIPCWFIQQLYHYAIPDLLFWNSFDNKQKQIVFEQVRKLYRKLSVFRGRIIVMPLFDIELDKIPQTMVDPNKIFEYISKPLEEPKSGNPLQPGDYMFLKWTMLAEKFYPQVNAPIIKEIIHAVSFSTEELVEEVSIELPIFLQGKLGEQGNIGEEIIDHLLSRFSEEE